MIEVPSSSIFGEEIFIQNTILVKLICYFKLFTVRQRLTNR